MVSHMKSFARYFFAASLIAVAACESATSPIARAAGDDAQYGKGGSAATLTATVLTVSAKDVMLGQPITVTATLYTSGHPLGGKKISISVDGGAPQVQTGSRTGTATWTLSGLGLGTHSIDAKFNGDNGYAASSASTTVTVNP